MQKLQELPQLVAMVNSEQEQAQIQAVTSFRKLLSIERNPPIQQVIDSGVVPRLVHFLRTSQSHVLQVSASHTFFTSHAATFSPRDENSLSLFCEPRANGSG